MAHRNNLIIALLFLTMPLVGQTIRPEYKAKGFSGNPVFEGWYADPEGIIYGDTFWIFPTWSDEWGEPLVPLQLSEYQKEIQKNTINPQYLKQTFLDAFSSKDLVNWTKHPKVLDIKDISWAAYSIWAPSVIHANDQYYLFFGANDIQSDEEPGGIGVAVAERPEGPYRDAIGAPLINAFHNGAQPIDQYVFRDDDGQYYLYYGGWRHCNVVRLRSDLLGIESFPDGETFKEITPEHYVEGPFVFKRNGRYYFMWSEGGWTGPNYSVAYAIGDSPTGPFTRIGKILQQNPEVATGAGHHSVIHPPGTDDYYIVYHRRPLGDNNGHHREVCIDRMYFNDDGTIRPVEITFEGVEGIAQLDATVGEQFIDVTIDGELFTRYVLDDKEKYPFFFPVKGPSGASVTAMRNNPYPHQNSLFLACDAVNGGNYWQDSLERGQIRAIRAEVLESGGGRVVIENENIWSRQGAESPIRDVRTITITAPSTKLYQMDFDIRLDMLEDVTIGKTHHSLFCVRVAHNLAVKGGGTMVNADGNQGETGEQGTFGKPSPWMACYAHRNGKTEGIAVFEHPDNPWYPAPWFTRDYGLISPTSFYWPDDEAIGTTFKKGDSLQLKYRVLVFCGTPEEAGIAEHYNRYLSAGQ